MLLLLTGPDCFGAMAHDFFVGATGGSSNHTREVAQYTYCPGG